MSNAMRKLQDKIGVGADGSFGPNTAKAIAKHYELSPERAAHLLGQSSHESGGFKVCKENLNYSWEGLMKTWPTRFKTEDEAKKYHRDPAKIAGKVYLRKSLGNLSVSDAQNFIGRGFLQCTGKANYRLFASEMGVPDVMTDPTALWFFRKNKLFPIADEGVNEDVIRRITKKVNGGYHGIEDRIDQTTKIHTWLS